MYTKISLRCTSLGTHSISTRLISSDFSRIYNVFYARSHINFKHPQTFTMLSQLTYFLLSPNSGIAEWKFRLQSTAFHGLSKLKYVEIAKSGITDIRYTFQGVTGLTHLGLEGNEITELEPDEFDDLKSLVYLDLDGNGIRVASADAFNGLIRLNQLFLSGNPLFPLNSIYRLTTLTRITLNYNSYRTPPPIEFKHNSSQPPFSIRHSSMSIHLVSFTSWNPEIQEHS